jgi:hypothetical protein
MWSLAHFCLSYTFWGTQATRWKTQKWYAPLVLHPYSVRLEWIRQFSPTIVVRYDGISLMVVKSISLKVKHLLKKPTFLKCLLRLYLFHAKSILIPSLLSHHPRWYFIKIRVGEKKRKKAFRHSFLTTLFPSAANRIIWLLVDFFLPNVIYRFPALTFFYPYERWS